MNNHIVAFLTELNQAEQEGKRISPILKLTKRLLLQELGRPVVKLPVDTFNLTRLSKYRSDIVNVKELIEAADEFQSKVSEPVDRTRLAHAIAKARQLPGSIGIAGAMEEVLEEASLVFEATSNDQMTGEDVAVALKMMSLTLKRSGS